MTRVFAMELGPEGITVNAVAPGLTLSDGVIGSGDGLDARTEEARRLRLLAVDILPGDVAATVVHVASGGGAAITGQTIVVDGGSVYN